MLNLSLLRTSHCLQLQVEMGHNFKGKQWDSRMSSNLFVIITLVTKDCYTKAYLSLDCRHTAALLEEPLALQRCHTRYASRRLAGRANRSISFLGGNKLVPS